MPEQPRPETNPQESGHTSENDLARLLQESSAETDRSAANLLADTLHQSIEERRGVIRRALGPELYAEAYAEANAEIKRNNEARSYIDEAFAELDAKEIRALEKRSPDFPDEEFTDRPEAVQRLENVEAWLDREISVVLHPYELSKSRLWTVHTLSDGGKTQVTASMYAPNTVKSTYTKLPKPAQKALANCSKS